MNRTVSLGLALAAALSASAVSASDLCDVAEADRMPMDELQARLESEGMTIRNIKVDDGCYEVYATDADGKRVENYYDPATFELVESE